MTLLRIGNTVVNPDNIAAVHIYEPGEISSYRYEATEDEFEITSGYVSNPERVVRLETTALTSGDYGSQAYQIEFAGDDAEAFVRWLDANATNLTSKTEMDEEWEAYKQKGGEMSRSVFEASVERLRDLIAQLDVTDADLQPARWKNLMDRAARFEKELLY